MVAVVVVEEDVVEVVTVEEGATPQALATPAGLEEVVAAVAALAVDMTRARPVTGKSGSASRAAMLVFEPEGALGGLGL